MKPGLEIELPYPAGSGNHSVRHGGGAHYVSAGTKAYRAQVLQQLNPRGTREPMAGPLRVEFLIAPPDGKGRDFDNLKKVVGDALTLAGVWTDDSNKVIKSGCWEWCDPMPGGRVFVTIFQGA